MGKSCLQISEIILKAVVENKKFYIKGSDITPEAQKKLNSITYYDCVYRADKIYYYKGEFALVIENITGKIVSFYSKRYPACDLESAKEIINCLYGVKKLLRNLLNRSMKSGDRNEIKVEVQKALKSVLAGNVLTFYVQKGFDYCVCNIINKSGEPLMVGVSEGSLERAIFDFLAIALNLSFLREGTYLVDCFDEYLNLLGFKVENHGLFVTFKIIS